MMPYDLESLRLIAWSLLGLTMLALVLTEGLSIGATLLLPLLAKEDAEWQYLLRRIAPVGLMNIAWLLAGMMLLFAAWPVVYAVLLSSFSSLLLPAVLSLLLRPLFMSFYAAIHQECWRSNARKILMAAAWLPGLLFGLLLGNVLKGIPFHLESDMRIQFYGDFAGMFNLFALLVAATCLAALAMYGAAFWLLKADGELQRRAKAMLVRASVAFLLLFGLVGLWVTHLDGYHISSDILSNGVANPLAKFVKRGEGLWLDNYEHIPQLWTVPLLAGLAAIAAVLLALKEKHYWALLASALALAAAVMTLGVSMFPFLLPSNISLNSSLTIWDANASQLSLQLLLSLELIALPLLLLVSRWVSGQVLGRADMSGGK